MLSLPITRFERLRHAVKCMVSLAESNLDGADGVIAESAAQDDLTEWNLLLEEIEDAAGRAMQ